MVLAGDLAQTGAFDEVVEDALRELRALEPIGGPERLLAEVAPAVDTAEPLDALGRELATEESGADPAPRIGWAAME